jgi:hypothetical protein
MARAADEMLRRIPAERTSFVRTHGAERPHRSGNVHDDHGFIAA